MLLGFKTELDLNNKQRTLAAQHAGVARHAYNWGLAVCKGALENKHKLPTAIDLHKRLVAEVKKENPWYYQVSKCAPQQALRNLEAGFKSWRKGERKFPVFKKRGRRDSFYLEGSIKISGNRIRVPIFGWLKCHEQLPATCPKNVTISRQADRWFISFKFEAPEPELPEKEEKEEVVGVDLGINNLATCSNSKVFANPKPYRKAKKRLKRLQRQVSRKKKGSQNRKKAVRRVAKVHKRIADIRNDSLHKITTYLTRRHRVVVIEDVNYPSPTTRGTERAFGSPAVMMTTNLWAGLQQPQSTVTSALENSCFWCPHFHYSIFLLALVRGSCGSQLNVSGMLKNHRLAGSIADCGFYEFRRQLEYKCKLYGCQLVVADRFYPSSQLCSRCEHRQKIPLHQRLFRCERCGLEIDRDLNSAINLVKWYLTTLSSRESHACGDSSAGVGSPTRYESLKQEESNTLDESPLLFSIVQVFRSGW